ncbi:unnamed protein product [Mytilus coruscus]|uniref:Uncharacterized protein n=1 Tax=Mytilus coruscus TaxID=42192 RepID=A0A6J8C928_MYTCO|nr:unnamed protein product [Mytilus coruscus]
MYETFVAKFNAEITEGITNLWRSECEKEEIEFVQIWKRKQHWLEENEEHFGDLFLTEENTQTTHDERLGRRDNKPQYTEHNSIIRNNEYPEYVPEGNSLNTETNHPRIINLSHKKLQSKEIIILKRGLKFTPTPKDDKTQHGADIDEFGRRSRINYIFCEDNEE